MKLKTYQQQTLAVLDDFFRRVRDGAPHSEAFDAAVETALNKHDLDRGRYATPYHTPAELEGVPYVCLRIPTGGGKTLLAAHTVGHAAQNLLELNGERPLALWFTNSETIQIQTVEALQDPRHPYRQALQSHFQRPVSVWDAEDFDALRPDNLEGPCILVATIQSLKKSDKKKAGEEGDDGEFQERLRVYRHRENLSVFFANLTAAQMQQSQLHTHSNGRPVSSFVNLLKLHRPLMLVDEAHGAVTGLTRDLQRDISPCAIVEFTATPVDKGKARSNILVSIPATTLKSEHIIKLPIILAAHATWKDTIAQAVRERNRLATLAQAERQYLRPVILFQAENVTGEVTHEVLKKHLMEVENIPEAKIAVVTGDQRELDGINILSRDCAIEHVITVQALKEGWDCPFAYVLCSLANVRSNTAVEQFLGRVMRMPYAEKRSHPDLNCAYAHVLRYGNDDGWAAANTLKDKLVEKMGFADVEAQQSVTLIPLPLEDGGPSPPPPPLVLAFPAGADLSALPAVLRATAKIAKGAAGGEALLSFNAPITREDEATVLAVLPEEQREEVRRRIVHHRSECERRLSPAQQGKKFEVPLLHIWIQDELMLAEPEVFLSRKVWDLSDSRACPPRLTSEEFNLERVEKRIQMDVARRGGKDVLDLSSLESGKSQQDAVGFSDLTTTSLARWLGDECTDENTHPDAIRKFCLGIVEDQITAKRPLAELSLLRNRLARAIREKIGAYKSAAQAEGYQDELFRPGAKPSVTFDAGFRFPRNYPVIAPYEGSHRFKHHFYGPDAISKLKAKGEEFECARELDDLPGLEWWVRNLDSLPDQSFKLPLAHGWFYPDFVSKLVDGRIFVVEYKGGHLADQDEKKLVGELWQKHSGGKGVFVWVMEESAQRPSVAQQLERAIRTGG